MIDKGTQPKQFKLFAVAHHDGKGINETLHIGYRVPGADDATVKSIHEDEFLSWIYQLEVLFGGGVEDHSEQLKFIT